MNETFLWIKAFLATRKPAVGWGLGLFAFVLVVLEGGAHSAKPPMPGAYYGAMFTGTVFLAVGLLCVWAVRGTPKDNSLRWFGQWFTACSVGAFAGLAMHLLVHNALEPLFN